MIYPEFENIQLEEQGDRLKVVMPLPRKPLFLAVYTVLLLVWLGATLWMVVTLLQTSLDALSGLYLGAWILMLLAWTYVWYRLGRSVWRWWQYYAATREILFLDEEILIIRRPLSLLGVTDGYDMEHVSPFLYQEGGAIAFDYGSRGAQFGQGLEPGTARKLTKLLNRRFFPNALLEEEE